MKLPYLAYGAIAVLSFPVPALAQPFPPGLEVVAEFPVLLRFW